MALAASLVPLTACGGSTTASPEEVKAGVAEVCTTAAATLAAAPAPLTDADEQLFRAVNQEAAMTVLTATRSALKKTSDEALTRMERTMDGGFPILQGAWTLKSIAVRTLGTIDRLDVHATAAGLPSCGAAAWRVSDWEAIYARHAGERPSAEQFVAQVEDVCASTLQVTALGQTGVVGDVIAQSSAKRAIADFLRAADEIVPPEQMQSTYFSLLGAVHELDGLGTGASSERIAALIDDFDAATSALGVTC